MKITETYGIMLEALFNPSKTAKKLKGKVSIGEGAKAVVCGSIIPAILLALIVALYISFIGAVTSVIPFLGNMAGWIAGFGVIAAIIVLIVVPILAVASWIINTAIVFIFAKIYGAKGTFADLVAPWGYPLGGLMLFMWIPIVNIVLAFYSLYLLFVYLKVMLKMSSEKAAFAIITEIVVIVLIVFIVGFLGGR